MNFQDLIKKIFCFFTCVLFFFDGTAQEKKAESNVGKRYTQYRGMSLKNVISDKAYMYLDSLNQIYEQSNSKGKIELINSLYNNKRIRHTHFRLFCYFVCQNFVFEKNAKVRLYLLKLLESTGLEYWGAGYCTHWPFVFYEDYRDFSFEELENLYQIICVLSVNGIRLSEEYQDFLLELKKYIVYKCDGFILEYPPDSLSRE